MKRERSWPILAIFIIAMYFITPREWWSTQTFLFLGVTFLVDAISYLAEYIWLQRQRVKLLRVISESIFGIALMIGSFVAAPELLTGYSVDGIRMAARWIWGIGFLFFIILVYIRSWTIARLVKEKLESGKEVLSE